MPAPGTVWGANTWSVDAWAANTWADAVTPAVTIPRNQALSIRIGIGLSIVFAMLAQRFHGHF